MSEEMSLLTAPGFVVDGWVQEVRAARAVWLCPQQQLASRAGGMRQAVGIYVTVAAADVEGEAFSPVPDGDN